MYAVTTKYSFSPYQKPFTEDQYHAFKLLGQPELETMIQGIRASRWKAFREHHKVFMICLGLFPLGLLFCAVDRNVGGVIATVTILPIICLLQSAHSRAEALKMECQYLRQEVATVGAAASYDKYRRSRSQTR